MFLRFTYETFACVKVTANFSNAFPKDCETLLGGVDDTTKLAYLHEPRVLQNLASRYELNEIYVSCQGFLWITLYYYYI